MFATVRYIHATGHNNNTVLYVYVYVYEHLTLLLNFKRLGDLILKFYICEEFNFPPIINE